MFRMHLKIGFVLMVCAAVAACDRGSQDTRNNRYLSNDQTVETDSSAAEGGPASSEACRASAEALDQMISLSRGELQYREKAELLISDSAWAQLPRNYRVSLAQVVAHVAACPDGDPANTVVTVRSSESSTILAQGRYSDFAKK